ncbi:threonine/serine exporter family protein [Tepidibacter hydrothermalis]|uniref:Threonine/serine exporter family protein n=1 Tax=Tepidibacter hydrothermalis TaxID=3036126 RepID=A0ABY8E8L0_9FIRM|nr:threonine/serine exporter family protein [Tepidibacter hydrothermalis]WFD09246.1 threonine/serine exporter family protein [Tepidibacter hydrothermalis]
MSLYLHFIYSFLATIGFCIFFNVQKKDLLYASLTGSIGWTLYIYMNNITNSASLSSFIAATVIGLLGEMFARVNRKPVTVFIIPGIVPLVPGYGMYLTMLDIINNDFYSAAKTGSDTIFIAGSIAIGVVLVSSTAKMFKRRNKKNSSNATH